MQTRLFFLSLLGALPLIAQQGDRKEHASMDPVVPEKLIPPAPVLSVDEALKTFEVAPGFVIEPVAAEPLIDKPVCLDFDPAGRMWVCEMRGYMPDIDGKLESVPEGRIVILEDSNGDGQIDKRTVFMEKILLPRAIAVYSDGILFLDEHALQWVKREGDKPVGEVEVIDSNFASGGNVEHKPNGLMPNLDNHLYLAKSDRRLRRVGNEWVVEQTANRGQWGIARDDYGRLYHNNNSAFLFGDLLAPNLLQGNPGVNMKYKDFVQLGSNRTFPIRVTPGINRAYMAKSNNYGSDTLDPKTHKLINATAAAGMAIYRGTNFPRDWYGTAFVTESSVQLVKAIEIEESDGQLKGNHKLGEKEFLASTDERFRPVNAYTAPDGSLYILDFYHGIIQHKTYMTSYLRQQTLDRGLEGPGYGHGRIYRVRSKSGKLEPQVDIAKLEGRELVRMLMHANSWHRETAQRVLVERKDPATAEDLAKLATAGAPLARIHAIWTLEGMGLLKAEHLAPALREKDAKLQSSALWAATRLSPAELEKLEAVLVSVDPAGKEAAPYLARALGPVGTPKAHERLAKLVTSEAKTPFVREAAVSGLDGRESVFLAAHESEIKDKDLLGWIEQGSKMVAEKVDKGSAYSGADLASFERGKALYHGAAACFGCHGPDGAGLPSLGPPLDNSEWVTGKPEVLINIMLHGMTGPVTVAGELFIPAADMPGLAMNPAITDENFADIATYVRREWSNEADPVSAELVKKVREANKDRLGRPWTEAELKP
jgi:glucose/arabinose dehydrogenase/mono/diheme cytochrome c family protein